MRVNIERKTPTIDEVKFLNDLPLFSFIELNINEICNRKCPFCPRVDPSVYPNQNIHMSINTASNIAKQLKEINFSGIVNISGTGEPLLTKYVCDIVSEFGKRDIHIEIVTNGDVLKKKSGKNTIKKLYKSGLKQLVVSMYDGPQQINEFNDIFKECDIPTSLYTLRDRWYDKSENYGLLYTNRAGNLRNAINSKDLPCFYTAYAMYVDYNGDILLCCQDMYNRTVKFGNVAGRKLIDAWHDKKLNEFRRKLFSGERSIKPCLNCDANGRIFGSNHVKSWNMN